MMNEVVEQAGGSIVLHKELRIDIQVPHCPSINVIDLPGLVAGDTDGKKFPALTRNLIEVEKATAIFLMVVEATMPPNQSLAAQLLHEVGVGVFHRILATRSSTL